MTISDPSGNARKLMQPTAPAGAVGASRLQPWVRQISPVLPPALALIEMAALVALVLAEYFWDAFPDLTRVNPHPYWIAVLLLSLQYGTVSGLIAAGIAIIGTVLIGMPEPDIEERYFNYLIRVWTQPVLWLLVALVLGTFRARQIEQRDELVMLAENLRVRGATLLDHANNLRARCSMLERRIAMRETADTGQLMAALARLGEAEPGRWAVALKAVLDAGFPKSQISLYVVDGNNVRLVLTHQRRGGSQAADTPPPAELAAGHPLLAAVVAGGRAVCVIDAKDDVALRGAGVAAVPIFSDPWNAAERRVVGMLKADMLPPGQIDASTTRRLGVIAAHIAPVLQRGLVAPVAGTASLATAGIEGGGILDDAIPSVRKWRLLKWLPGGRSAPDGKDG